MISKEITHLIERMEMLEERLGISISGLYASVENETNSRGEYLVEINGEVYSQNGGSLSETIILQCICQNEKGQIVGKSDEYIEEDRFTGYYAFSNTVYCKVYPTRIKIVPVRE